MTKEKQIEELTNDLVFTNCYGTLNAVAIYLYNAGYRKQSEGEWITSGCGNTKSCSICGNIVTFKSNYCPNCGAKMKGGAE